jgi:uncharacterized protein YwqG
MSAAREDDFSNLSMAELEQAYASNIQAAEATEHVGRKNRLAGRNSKIFRELRARDQAREVFERLAKHSDMDVRRWAQSNVDWLNRPPQAAPPALQAERRLLPQLQWQCDHPPPAAMTRDEMAGLLQRAVPTFRDRLMALCLPAIGLWPQRRAEVVPTATRFGGMPLAPPGWQWPMHEKEAEPLLFVGQINCAELSGLPGAEQLPGSGLLSFFGDHDAVTGCFPFDSHCVFYWRHVERLVPAKVHPDPITVFPVCALVPRPILDMPYPDSDAVGEFDLNKQQRRSYFDVWQEIRNYGIPRDCASYASFSKLLGWPALVQNELQMFDSRGAERLLLQVDHYWNGETAHYWGPGGSLFYVIPAADLRARVFAHCELEGQFT